MPHWKAANRPTGPAPMMATSVSWVWVMGRKYRRLGQRQGEATARNHRGDSLFDISAINEYNIDMPASTSPAVASITIRNLDPALKERLRVRAAGHGHSMEAEARRILQDALTAHGAPPLRHLYDRVRARFASLGGVDLELPPREPVREPPRFE